MSASDPPSTDASRLSEIVGRFLSLADVNDPEFTAAAERQLAEQLAEVHRLGLRESDLAVMGQAYIRSVGRIAAAEAEAVSRLRHRGDADGSHAAELTGRFLPLGRDIFDLLHGLFLSRAVAGGPRMIDRSRRSPAPVFVAHVDVIASTAFLEHATLGQTYRLVDGLFNSAQSAIRGRAVEASKYVGDGVFLVGPEPEDVALAALDCIRGLEAEAGLTSRAGLACGRVVHRAGDVFGLPVNLCAILTKAAGPGRLLVTAEAAERLPESMRVNPRAIPIRGLEHPVDAFELDALGPASL